MADAYSANSRSPQPQQAPALPGGAAAVRVWQPWRGPLQRWPNLTDFLLATFSFAATLTMWFSAGLTMATFGDVVALLCAFIGNYALLWRRSHPLHVHAVVVAASILALVGPVSDGIVALAFSLYSLGRYTANDRASLIGMLAALALVGADLLVPGTPDAGSVIAAGLVMLLWYIGRRLRFRGEYLRLLEERAEHLERERSAEAEQAVARERTRIARELHDIVAHQVSLMTVQAGAARTVARSDPEAASQAMGAVEKAGRQALSEMRHLLSVLRPGDGNGELAPQPGMAELERLVDEVGEAGPAINLTTEGTLTNLPARLDLAVYRIIQEALTNVLKHAGPNPSVDVSVRATGDCVELRVFDDGPGRTGHVAGGHGIAGMRERAELLGGSLSAVNAPTGGFEVRASLPVGTDP